MGIRSDAACALVAVLAAACDRGSPAVVCHNSNCAGEIDSTRDDTLPAMRESLALDYHGRPPFDGVEIDTFWDGSNDRCLFAHGHEQVADAPPAIDAAGELAAFILASDRPSFGERFLLKVELKGEVGPDFEPHDQEDLAPHVDCALEVVDIVRAAAAASAVPLDVLVDTADPALARAAVRRPGWDASGALLCADFGAPRPLTSYTERLSEFPSRDLDAAEFYPGLITDAQLEVFRSLDLTIGLWMFIATTDVLDGIEHIDPDYVVTNEAMLLRRWIER